MLATGIRIDVTPHPSQRVVHRDKSRFKVLAAGRRWGKTRLGVCECIDVAARGGRAWWVAPSYKMSEPGWRSLRRLGNAMGPEVEVRKGDRQVLLPSGGEVTVRSADDPDSLRGDGLDYVVIDECAFVSQGAWKESLRPALSDKQGGALFISTPKGRNWFWELWQRGRDDHESDWQSWQFPTSDNPHIAPLEIEDAHRDLPERIFRQEFLAEFIEDAGAVFRNVSNCIGSPATKPQEGHQYVMGVDWGKSEDFTVIIVMDLTEHEIVAMDRFNQIDYRVQRQRLMALAERWRPTTIVAEANAMGEPIIEQLQADGLPVQGFTTTNATKARIIENLALAFERGSIIIPADDVLIGELQAYTMDRLPSGRIRYNAPEGMHDDCVMALALALDPDHFWFDMDFI